MKSFLFANVPLSVVHAVAGALGIASGGVLWWALMVVNSLVWGAVLSLFVFPLIRKLLK